MDNSLKNLQMERSEIPADFDFRDIQSPDEMNILMQYYQIYSSALPIDVDDPNPPDMVMIKCLTDAMDLVAKYSLQDLERKAAAGDWEARIELGLRHEEISILDQHKY